jgi:integrase/recombinase XerD
MLGTCGRRTFAGDRDRALMLALLDTGCRASEFLALDLGDLDLHTGALTLRQTKGKRARTVFTGRTTLREVLRYLRHRADLAPSDPLWVNRDGERLAYFGLTSVLRRRAKAAGIRTSLPHAFRRAFALASLRQGMDVVSLQRLLGHADLSVISRYVKQSRDDLQKSHAEHGPVDSFLRG